MAFVKGIDVSRWQGAIDWEAVREDGIQFAFIKAGGSDCGFYEDLFFDVYMKEAYAAGIKIGVYYYVGPRCTSFDDGEADGKRLVEICSKWKPYITLPLVIDFEAPPARDKAGNTAAVRGFCKAVTDAGYSAMVYASETSGFSERLNLAAIPDILKWCAKWSSVEPKSVDWTVWQQTSEGHVDGISTPVDIDFFDPAAWSLFNPVDDPGTGTLKAALANLKAAIEKVEAFL